MDSTPIRAPLFQQREPELLQLVSMMVVAAVTSLAASVVDARLAFKVTTTSLAVAHLADRGHDAVDGRRRQRLDQRGGERELDRQRERGDKGMLEGVPLRLVPHIDGAAGALPRSGDFSFFDELAGPLTGVWPAFLSPQLAKCK